MSDPSPPVPPGTVLLPTNRFFVRVVPLAAEGSPVRQIELALENRASFPVNQLYYGYLLAPGGDSALVFAAYRKRFSAAETATWTDAVAVVPSFLAQLNDIPTTSTILLWPDENEITAVAWDGVATLPLAVMARERGGLAETDLRASLVAEIGERVELPGAVVREFSGPAKILNRADLETADVRDKEFLAEQKNLRKRDTILWRGLQGCLAGLALLALVEAGLVAAKARLTDRNAQVQSQSAGVARIETAQSISRRIEEMTQRRLLPLEMLAVANGVRPTSVQFLRAVTNGLHVMEIEAQTTNAADVGLYETALRAVPEVASVETRDLRSREGITSFVLALTYKPAALHQEGAP